MLFCYSIGILYRYRSAHNHAVAEEFVLLIMSQERNKYSEKSVRRRSVILDSFIYGTAQFKLDYYTHVASTRHDTFL